MKRTSALSIESLIHDFPNELKKKTLCYKKNNKQYENAFGKLLLQKALMYYGYNGSCLNDLRYTSYERPYINSDIDFNISHSGKFIVCAVSSYQRVGIDIEKVREVNFDFFTNTLNNNEWQSVFDSNNPSHEFYKFWTQKESVIKTDGKGLTIPLQDVLVSDYEASIDMKEYYLKEIEIDHRYSCHLCSDLPITKFKLHKVNNLE